MVQAATRIQIPVKRGDVRPAREEFDAIVERQSEASCSIPIFRDIMADLETPVSAYLKVTDGGKDPGFLLESVEGGERLARYSFIGAAPLGSVTMREGLVRIAQLGDCREIAYDDPIAALQSILAAYPGIEVAGLPRFTGGAVGYLSYEAVRAFEPRVGLATGPGLAMPDGRFHLVDSLLVFDHLERIIKVVSHAHLGVGQPVADAYEAAIARVDALVRLCAKQLRRCRLEVLLSPH